MLSEFTYEGNKEREINDQNLTNKNALITIRRQYLIQFILSYYRNE